MFSMDLKLAIKGDTEGFARDLLKEKTRIATVVNRKASRRTRRYIKTALRGAGFGKRSNPLTGSALVDLVKYADDPARGYALKNTSVVYSKMDPRWSRGKNRVDLLAALQDDQQIEAKGGKWLVIPVKGVTPLGSRGYLMPKGSFSGGSRRSRRHGEQQMTAALGGTNVTAFVEFKKGTLAGIVGTSGPFKGQVIWWLVKRVHIKRKLPSFEALHLRSSAKMQEDFNREMSIAGARLATRYNLVSLAA